jgi:L-cysteine:1D-myo-inositol 2-amino-2-deoxy-alpha-D-glucopyranoside ligase
VRIYDTQAQRIVEAVLPTSGEVKIYTCGITPYDSAHLGHAAVYVTFDVLSRHLRRHRLPTRCVRNITDVDDDILRKARELGTNYLDLAAMEIAQFDHDMAALGVERPAVEPRATSAIPNILALIQQLFDRGHAYEVDGWVYFSVETEPTFGSISHLGREEMIELARERGGNPDDPRKRDPLDFVLWQPSLPDEPAWASRFGPGRPGWHIECSALAMRELGPVIDIHGGGSDLIFPHHECEAAQSHAATGQAFVRHWVHVGMVRLDGVKMSKSLGNLVFVRDLLKEVPAPVLRLALLSQHYRSSWDWVPQLVEEARERWELWRHAGEGDAASDAVDAALDEDLDTPGALEAIDRAARVGRGVSTAAAMLGVSL